MSYGVFSRVPTCISHSITFVEEKSGRLKSALHFSLVEMVPAAVFHVTVTSLRKRNFLMQSLLTCVLVDPESKSIRIPVVFGFPKVLCRRPNAIGARCTVFCRFVGFLSEALTFI